MRRKTTKPTTPRPIPETVILAGMAKAVGVDVERITLRTDGSGEKIFLLDGKELAVDITPTASGDTPILFDGQTEHRMIRT